MTMPFDDVFAGVRMRLRKVERDSRVDHRAAVVAKRNARGDARGQRATGNAFDQ
jgi:hypothetical protein